MQAFPKGSILLVSNKLNKQSRLYKKPAEYLSCQSLQDVPSFLERIETCRRKGLHLAGYFSYELGYAFEEKLRHKKLKQPCGLLGWFAAFESLQLLNDRETQSYIEQAKTSDASPDVNFCGFDMSKSQYEAAFQAVRDYIAKGDIYQVNLAMRAKIDLNGCPIALFQQLLFSQPVDYAALINTGEKVILSLSPECFLSANEDSLTTKPMKGTIKRGRTLQEDLEHKQSLQSDAKSRAENIMILDLMRNDLSRVCVHGTVKASNICHVETYRSLLTMTSTVTGQLHEHSGLKEAIRELFPCGSITGAPKLRAMEIIDELEASSRGIYTGSIGYIEPSGDYRFNVAIRTLEIDDNGRGTIGAGGGIVWDSGVSAEYDECRLKLNFLTGNREEFTIFETLKWTPEDGYLLLARHMKRLEASANYFGFNVSSQQISTALNEHVVDCDTPQRVRVDLSENGDFSVKSTALNVSERDKGQVWLVALSDKTVSSQDRFLFHKTSRRSFYDNERSLWQSRLDLQEVIFTNESGFLTEGSFTNIFLKKDGILLTPCLMHGLLPGTFRQGLLDLGLAVEADLKVDDLKAADELFVANSVRGLKAAKVVNV
ncbi:aminodeoxychorismate synthase component I [Polycladidibacter stylochi]|uniref:aminodeoxychorismate synthase component I n=1 Tax=Polycladidibacter stylochi TaxID=1807766 RepID=UPI000834FDBE|nr:aminodeoxychorismate synthase component I [Pseudovibrio stylochi]